jgi:hypothetical protein
MISPDTVRFVTTSAPSDSFGQPLTAAVAAAAAWRHAYNEMLCFTGDPIASLAAANANDDTFVMGPVFVVAYQLLSGANPRSPAVLGDLDRARVRSERATPRERRHVEAVVALHSGEFHDAAMLWHAITFDFPEDFTAYRFAHDVCLHIGDNGIRLPSAERAVAVFPVGSVASGRAYGMLSFALNEVGQYDEAEAHGRRSIATDDGDIWGLHALAHVYESTENTEALSNLLVGTSDIWTQRSGLNNHIWWHLGLRQLHAGDIAAAMQVFDEQMVSTTAFGLADATSLLWRTDLADRAQQRGARWASLADRWAMNEHRHTCGFLDVHAAAAFAVMPGHPGAEPFWQGVAVARDEGITYNDKTMSDTVPTVVDGLRAFAEGRWGDAVDSLSAALATLHRIGGSVVQRDLILHTLATAEAAS